MMSPELHKKLVARVYTPVSCLIEVHKVLGPFLNEYMYQDALSIEFTNSHQPFQREFYFSVDYKGTNIKHKHYVDFVFGEGEERVIIECKAVETLTSEHRQQLWNYMRLTGIEIGVLYNFAPPKAQIERYYLSPETPVVQAF